MCSISDFRVRPIVLHLSIYVMCVMCAGLELECKFFYRGRYLPSLESCNLKLYNVDSDKAAASKRGSPTAISTPISRGAVSSFSVS